VSVAPVFRNTGSSDAEILARAKVTITLAGNSYEWTEVGRRESRQMLLEMIPIVGLIRPGADDPAGLLKSVDECLDFFYRHHAAMRRDKEHLDDHATNKEVLDAFTAVYQVINCPFLRDLAEAGDTSTGTLTPNPGPSS
jgi:hypothetical protein